MLSISEIMSQFDEKDSVSISFYYHSDKILKTFDALFLKLLAKMDMIYLLDPIVTILRELVANAVKANAKRIYFEKKAMDIYDSKTYEEGMKNFKFDLLGNEKIEDELRTKNYSVVLKIKKQPKVISVVVENSVIIHPEELKRINKRIENAKGYEDFTEAYNDIYDEIEGAGLGIVLTILLLRNIGIGDDAFSITSDGKKTQSSFFLPYELKTREITTKIKEQIIREVDGLPSFNPNFMELLHLCKNPEASIEIIQEKIIVDPALTSEILKLSNSAGYFPAKRIENLNEAIMIIGLSKLHDMLIVINSRQILEKRYSVFKEIWKHCTITAAYARYIAQKNRKTKNFELPYIGGLLHDLGKLILLATDNQFTGWVSDLTKNRKIRVSTVLEEVSIGISHSTIGELLAKKWNFPESLVNIIKDHHAPLNAAMDLRDVVYPVYLANVMAGFESGKYQYLDLEEEVLKHYGLTSQKSVEDLLKELKQLNVA